MSCSCCARLHRELGAAELFDAGVEAARNACVAGASLASAAITASAWYDNPLCGAGALRECMQRLGALPLELSAWIEAFSPRVHPETSDPDWVPGFGFVSLPQRGSVLRAAERLRGCASGSRLGFFLEHQRAITALAGPLNGTGLAALVFSDHGLSLDDAERCFLLAHLDVALAQAASARRAGLAKFPFFTESYVYEGERPPLRQIDMQALMRQVGL
ncbi:MAG: hypothetical protein QM756_04130 [Polyangiaceae bacterium]